MIKNFRNPKDFNENNIWEEVALNHDSGRSVFNHFFRFEQRFIQQFAVNNSGDFTMLPTQFLTRFRYRFAWSLPLFKLNNKSVFINAFEELWLNTGNGIVPKSLNQNWFRIGFNSKIFNNLQLNIGYLNIYTPQGSNSYLNSHILHTLLVYTIK